MDDLQRLALALFDLAQSQNTFDRLESCLAEQASVARETDQLRRASDNLEREIIALDEQRASISKLIDAAFPPEAKQAAESVFAARFADYFTRAHALVERHMMDARALEVDVAAKLAAAQKAELDQIAILRPK
jgi:F0F1-type ATP synthase delta subunit